MTKQPKRKHSPAATSPRCVVCGDDLECPTCSAPHDEGLAELAAQLDAALPDLTDWEVADLRELIAREIERRGPAVCAGLRPAIPAAGRP